MCMCTCTLTCGRLSLQMLTLLTFVEMCVRSSVTRILVRRLERILLHAPPPQTLSDSSSRAALSQPESVHL